MPIVIAVYNHKGGVGKTTAALNIAYVLGEKLKKKVLIADLDPQANATSFVQYPAMESSEIAGDYDYQKKYYESCEKDASDSDPERRVYRTLRDALRPSLDPIDPSQIDIDEVAPRVRPEQVADYNNVDILPGHLDIGNIDSPMTLGAAGLGGMRQYTSQFNNLLRKVRSRDGKLYDIIILDLGPGIGGLNKCAIMGSDYICAPYAPDYFSQVAIDNLGTLLEIWNRDFNDKRLWRHFDGKQDVNRGPIFLGAFPQRVRVKKYSPSEIKIKQDQGRVDNGDAKILQSHASWMQRIRDTIIKLTDMLRPLGMVSASFPTAEALGGVQDQMSLAQDVMHFGRPVSDLQFQHRHVRHTDTSSELQVTQVKHDNKAVKEYRRSRHRRLHHNQVDHKEKAALAYLRLVGVLMQGLTKEDKDILGDEFVSSCSRMCDLSEGIDTSIFLPAEVLKRQREDKERASKGKSDVTSKSSSAAAGKKKKRTFESFKYAWYESTDMSVLFARYLDAIPNHNVHYMAALGDIDNVDSIKEIIRSKLAKVLNETLQSGIDDMQYVYLPLNLGDRHWVLVYVGFKISSMEVNAWYFDPLGIAISHKVSSIICGALSDAFPGNAEGNSPHWRQDNVIQRLMPRVRFQLDDYNCGPWVVEAAVLLARNDRLPGENYDIASARQKHWDDELRVRYNPPAAARRKSKATTTSPEEKSASSTPSSNSRKRRAPAPAEAAAATPAANSASLFAASSGSGGSRRDANTAKDPRLGR
jgi:cellulose biosynthesis protein BcsQ